MNGGEIPQRLIFMGTPDFAAVALTALLDAGHDIVAVYSQPPRPAGRGKRPRPSPVQQLAEDRGIPVLTPISLKDPDAQAEFASFEADAAVVVAYGLILPPDVLAAPRLGCFNIHASLLPRWRGAAPIQRAIMAGDEESGVCIMQMDVGLDTGPVLAREVLAITSATNGGSLHDALADLGAGMIVATLADANTGSLNPAAQPDQGVTYAAKLTREDGRLDWSRPAAELERVVRAMYPAPGAWFEFKGERFKVLAADVLALGALGNAAGTVLDPDLTVACGDGALRLTRLQRPGKSAMEAEALLRGYPIPPGTILE
jgi:methionyl-tRNA formyltransferase